MTLAPIVLFVYNRPIHTLRALESLMMNDLAVKSELFIYADGPKEDALDIEVQKIKEVRKTIRNEKWCGKVSISEFDKNEGLANSVIRGVSEVVHKYGKVIVLEDDLIVSDGFLEYMNKALTYYEKNEKVAGVSGYVHPVKQILPETFFLRLGSSWGWGTWERAWECFNHDAENLIHEMKGKTLIAEFNLGERDFFSMLLCQARGEIDSWAIRFYASFFLKEMLFLFPQKSFVQNIGWDSSGTHTGNSKKYVTKQLAKHIELTPIELKESESGRKAYIDFFSTKKKKGVISLWNSLKRIWHGKSFKFGSCRKG